MSVTKINDTSISLFRKAGEVIKNADNHEISFTDEECKLIKERFNNRLRLWVAAFSDTEKLDVDEMMIHFKQWLKEVNTDLPAFWIKNHNNDMDTYYNLEADYNDFKMDFFEKHPYTAVLSFYNVLASVFHVAGVFEETAAILYRYVERNHWIRSQVTIVFEKYSYPSEPHLRDYSLASNLNILDSWLFCFCDCMYYSLGSLTHLRSFRLTNEISSKEFARSLKRYLQAVRYGLGSVAVFKDRIICYCIAKYHLDSQYRLNNLDGPVYVDPFGKKEYFIKGVKVPEYLVTDPGSISVKGILSEKNQEVKSIMLEIYGTGKFVSESKAKVIDSFTDKHGTSELLEIKIGRGELGFFAKVICPSTLNEYLLRVPRMRTLKEAIAWTFGINAEDYQPLIET